MGTFKKEAARRSRQGKAGDGLGNVRVKGENFYRYVPNHNSFPSTLYQVMLNNVSNPPSAMPRRSRS